MLYPFLQILLQTLIQKSHDLLQEEICSCVYSMAAVDFTTYHQEFFPKFLTSVGEGLSEAQQAELAKNYKMVEVRNILLFRDRSQGQIQDFQQGGGWYIVMEGDWWTDIECLIVGKWIVCKYCCVVWEPLPFSLSFFPFIYPSPYALHLHFFPHDKMKYRH